MKKFLFTILLPGTLLFFASCSNAPNRKVAGGNAPAQAEKDVDGRVKMRSSAENRKRMEYYNNVQHR